MRVLPLALLCLAIACDRAPAPAPQEVRGVAPQHEEAAAEPTEAPAEVAPAEVAPAPSANPRSGRRRLQQERGPRSRDELVSLLHRGPLVSAHRGGPAPGHPENAMVTLRRSHRLGVVLLEVDVRRTSDDVLVLLHDDDLDRTTTGRGPLLRSDFASVRQLRLVDPEGARTTATVPTLDEALRWAREAGAVLTLDVKNEVRFEDVVAAVRGAQAEGHATIITYSIGAMRRVRRLAPELVVSTDVDRPGDLEELLQQPNPDRLMVFVGVVRSPSDLDRALVSRLDAANVLSIVGTFPLDDHTQTAAPYSQLYGGGVDVVATDRPLFVQRSLRQ